MGQLVQLRGSLRPEATEYSAKENKNGAWEEKLSGMG